MTEEDIQFNPLNHDLVPLHEKMEQEEIEAELGRLGLTPLDLPWILETDAVSRVLKLRRGDVVRITRNSPTAGHHIVYRRVVPDPMPVATRRTKSKIIGNLRELEASLAEHDSGDDED